MYADAILTGQARTAQWPHAPKKTTAPATENALASTCVNATPTGWAIHVARPTVRV